MNSNHMIVALLKTLMAALVLAGAAAVCVKTRFLKNQVVWTFICGKDRDRWGEL
jgi:hypothetical protein